MPLGDLRRRLPRPVRDWLLLRRFQASLLAERVVEVVRPTHLDSSQDHVLASYEDWYTRPLVDERAMVRPSIDGGRLRFATQDDVDAAYASTHARLLRPVPGEAVLEVGCGFGRTLLPLASRCKGARFVGIEPTVAGPRRLREHAAGFSVLPLGVLTANGAALPFADASFDAAYTNLVLEQIGDERLVFDILGEIRRVVRGRVGFLEPWRDAQTALTVRHVERKGYLPCASAAVAAAGFVDVQVHDVGFHHNPRFRVSYVTASAPR